MAITTNNRNNQGNNLGLIVLATAIGLGGCQQKQYVPEYVTGIVLAESGTIVDQQQIIERSEGAIFGNDSILFADPTYAIQFKGDDGLIYTVGIEPSGALGLALPKGDPEIGTQLGALNLAIHVGTRIKIDKNFAGLYSSVDTIRYCDLIVLPHQ